jgi:hypothetical protein
MLMASICPETSSLLPRLGVSALSITEILVFGLQLLREPSSGSGGINIVRLLLYQYVIRDRKAAMN